MRAANSQFKKTDYANINVDQVQKEVAQFLARAQELKVLEDKFNALPDSKNKATEDIHDVLHALVLNLRLMLEKLNTDFQKIAPDIKKAVDAKKTQQSLEKSAAAASEFKKLSDELVSAANVFAVSNVFEQGISAKDEEKWITTIAKIGTYISDTLKKPRSFGQGISESNQKLLKDAWSKIASLYIRIFNVIKEARQKNSDFKAVAGLTHGGVDWITERLDDFAYQAHDIVTVRKALKPTFASKVSDGLDVKNMKDIEDKNLEIVYEFIQKMKKDWCQVLSKISGAKTSASTKLCAK
jgi:hypothetical protein